MSSQHKRVNQCKKASILRVVKLLVTQLSGFHSLFGICFISSGQDQRQYRSDFRGVLHFESVGSVGGVANVVDPGDWRETTKLYGVVSVVQCTWVLYPCLSGYIHTCQSGWCLATQWRKITTVAILQHLVEHQFGDDTQYSIGFLLIGTNITIRKGCLRTV